MVGTTKAQPPGARVAELSWPDVQARLQGGAVALLPVGAAAKEHGPHLPMQTDYLQAEWLVSQLLLHAPVLAWPTIPYGHYPAFVDYPGSCSLTQELFRSMAAELLGELRHAGAARILVINTGISTIAPLEEAVADAGAGADCRLANVYQGPRFRETAARLIEQPAGGHADEVETSIMLAVAAFAVNMEKAAPGMLRSKAPGSFRRNEPNHPNYCPTGVHGDPTRATTTKGSLLVSAMLQDVLEMLQDW